MPLRPFLLILCLLAGGCAGACRECTFGVYGVRGGASFPDAWNAAVVEDALLQLGFSMEGGNDTWLMTETRDGVRLEAFAVSNGSRLNVYYEVETRWLTRPDGEAHARDLWKSRQVQFNQTLAAFEDRTGWRHNGGVDWGILSMVE